MDQVGALRNRNVMDYIKRTQNGMYFKIGNSAQAIADASGKSGELRDRLISHCISSEYTMKVQNYRTTLMRPSKSNFELILQHGYEVAKCTNLCYTKQEEECKV
jgi:NTE family protein